MTAVRLVPSGAVSVTQAADTTGPSQSRQTLILSVFCFITSPRILFVDKLLSLAILKLVCQTSARRLTLKCLQSFVRSTNSCQQIGTSNSCPNFLSPSAASDCLAPDPPICLSGLIRVSAHSCPRTREGPTWAGPRRDKPGRGITVATQGGDVTRGRDNRPPALPPGPLT